MRGTGGGYLYFLAVVNFTINGYKEYDNASRLSLPTLLHYLKASHAYYIDFQLPFIRKELVEALDESDNLARLILKLYDEYAHSITNHMKYEEKPYSLTCSRLLTVQHQSTST